MSKPSDNSGTRLEVISARGLPLEMAQAGLVDLFFLMFVTFWSIKKTLKI